jgi:hypothetical protein
MKQQRFALDADQMWALGGIVAAMVIAVLLNVHSANHFKRWDWTEGRRYSLSPPTQDTLRSLAQPVEIWVLLGGGDPMEQSVKQILLAYRAETQLLEIHYIDPDRDAPALDEVRRRFHIETGRTEDGRVVTDAVMVVATKTKRWFISASDLIEVDAKDPTAKPREEQAITGAIRNVTREGDKTVLCFTSGHGERALQDGTEEGLGLFKDVLEKDNYETRTVDTTEPLSQDPAHEPFTGCAVVLVVPSSVRSGVMSAFSEPELERLRTWLLAGGNLLLAIGPETDAPAAGLSRVLQPFGIALDAAWVLEGDARFAFPDTRLNTFTPAVKTHAVTASLAPDPDSVRPPPRVVLEMVRPLRHVDADTAASDLLASSDQSFAVGFQRAAAIVRGSGDPMKEAGDQSGPFIVGMASERPKVDPKAAHGPRAVVIGSSAVFAATHWRQSAPWRGSAMLVENAIAWLASKPQVLDIPPRPSVAAGIRISEDSRDEVKRYVLIYMPLTVAILGVAMSFVRRSTENRKRREKKAS